MSTILVVAPHPDDETLGCGGTMLRHIARGDDVHWCIVTAMHESGGYSTAQIAEREKTIRTVSDHYGFSGTHQLGCAAANLDLLPRSDLVTGFSRIISEIAPERIYLPHPPIAPAIIA